MKFISRLFLIASVLTAMFQSSHSSGGPTVGGNAGNSAWTFSTPAQGGVYPTAIGYMGAGVPAASATLCVFQLANTNPNGVYPSELSLIRSNYVTTNGSNTWMQPGGAETGSLFATITPNPHELGEKEIPLFTSVYLEDGDIEVDVSTTIQTMSGDSRSFFVQGGQNNGGGGGLGHP